jgi:ankyrin repeat protein
MAVEELITIAAEMTKPFTHDTRYPNPRDCMPQLQHLVEELHSFADKLVSLALDLEAGPDVSNAQAALGSKHVAKSANWTDDHVALTTAFRKTTSWSPCDYPGLSHVLQIKLFRDRPDLLRDNAKPFLLYRDEFLLAARQLLDAPQFQVPSCLKSSQLFIPCAFARIPMIASQFYQSNDPDCLGRSVSHILYDAKVLKEWRPSDTHTLDVLARSSLYLACCERNHNRIYQLFRANVDPNVKAANGLYPFDAAVISGDIEVCRFVWKMESRTHVYMDSRYDTSTDISRRSPLLWAAYFGHLHIVKLLQVHRDTHPNTTALEDGWDCNVIGLAAMRGQKSIVEYLKDYQYDIPDVRGRSPLWYAASNGHLDILELLHSGNPLLNRQDNDGFTPVAIAAQNGRLRIVNHLRSIADLSIPTHTGQTPLSLATSAGHLDCVESLLRPSIAALGASEVRKIFVVAQRYGYYEICRVFHKHGLVT